MLFFLVVIIPVYCYSEMRLISVTVNYRFEYLCDILTRTQRVIGIQRRSGSERDGLAKCQKSKSISFSEYLWTFLFMIKKKGKKVVVRPDVFLAGSAISCMTRMRLHRYTYSRDTHLDRQ